MKPLKNFLLVSGAGQNTGKTTLVRQLIRQFSHLPVTAIKITPHIHSLNYPLPLLERGNGFVLYQEVFAHKQKDSSRFLEAGSTKVFLLLTQKESIREAIETLLKYTGAESPVICESGGLAQHYQPALHLFLKSHDQNSKAPVGTPDRFITFNGSVFDADLSSIQWENGMWSWPDAMDD